MVSEPVSISIIVYSLMRKRLFRQQYASILSTLGTDLFRKNKIASQGTLDLARFTDDHRPSIRRMTTGTLFRSKHELANGKDAVVQWSCHPQRNTCVASYSTRQTRAYRSATGTDWTTTNKATASWSSPSTGCLWTSTEIIRIETSTTSARQSWPATSVSPQRWRHVIGFSLDTSIVYPLLQSSHTGQASATTASAA